MGFLNALFGNASSLDPEKLQKEYVNCSAMVRPSSRRL